MADLTTDNKKSTCPTASGFSLLFTAFSLVPEALIDDENHDLWVNFLRERVPHNQQISRKDYPSLHCACLWEEGKQTKEHAIPFLLEKAQQLSDQTAVLAIRQDNHLAVVCLQRGALQLANIYDADTKEQTLYWLLKIYEELKLPATAPLYIRCGEGTRRLLYSHLNTMTMES